jgi:hypothetical protein
MSTATERASEIVKYRLTKEREWDTAGKGRGCDCWTALLHPSTLARWPGARASQHLVHSELDPWRGPSRKVLANLAGAACGGYAMDHFLGEVVTCNYWVGRQAGRQAGRSCMKRVHHDLRPSLRPGSDIYDTFAVSSACSCHSLNPPRQPFE